jgi:dihydrofolate reductase
MRAIAAMSGYRVIGYKGKLPWKNRRDMEFFKAMTWGQDIIVGRSTFESMGILKNRYHYVLSSDKTNASISNAVTSEEIVDFVTPDEIDISAQNKAWVIGGASVYHLLLPACTDLYLSVIPEDYEGDSYMPEFEGYFPEQRLIRDYKDLFIVHCWKPTTIVEEHYRDGFDTKLSGKYDFHYPRIPEVDKHLSPNIYHYRKGFNDAPYLSIE